MFHPSKVIALIFYLQCAFAQAESIKLILVGDSTMASKNGYGDGLCKKVNFNVECLNLAKNGRSSKSYKEEGSWQYVLKQLDQSKKNYVLIGFAHNDQPGKWGRSTELDSEFPNNLKSYISDLKNNNANVILVTPLTRRNFNNNNLVMDLMPWANKVKEVAKSEGVSVIDLYGSSTHFVKTIGHSESDKLALGFPSNEHIQQLQIVTPENSVENVIDPKSQFDHTHLGIIGEEVFSNMVKDLMKPIMPELF